MHKQLILIFLSIVPTSACKQRLKTLTGSEAKELPPESTCFYGHASAYRQALQQKIVGTQQWREACEGQTTKHSTACSSLAHQLVEMTNNIVAIETIISTLNAKPVAQRPPCNDVQDLHRPGLVIAGVEEFQELVTASKIFGKPYTPAHDCDDFSNELVARCSKKPGKSFEIYRLNFSCKSGEQVVGSHASTVAPVQWNSGLVEYCAIEPQRDPSAANLFDTCWAMTEGRTPPQAMVEDLCQNMFASSRAGDISLGELGQTVRDPSDRRLDPTYCSTRPAFQDSRTCYGSCCFSSFRLATMRHMRTTKRYDEKLLNELIGQCYSNCDAVVPKNKQLPMAARCLVGKPGCER